MHLSPLLLLTLACKGPTVDATTKGGGDGAQPQAPVAVVQAASEARVGDTVSFDGTGSYDPQGFALDEWLWSCTDGTEGEGETLDVQFSSDGEFTCTLTVGASESGLESSDSASVLLSRPQTAWTVMVFVNGDNNLEEAALTDLNEMEQVGSTDDVNIVVQVDRANGYTNADGNWTGVRRMRIEQDSDTHSVTSPVIEDLGELDSGDPDTVIDFVEWAISTYPAQRYALVMWDHGWGWSFTEGAVSAATKGVSSDEQSGQDISVAEGELEEVLAAAETAAGHRLALLGMDACIMQSWEVAHTAVPYAEAYVASQYYEGTDGWPYQTALADLVDDPDMDGAQLGDAIALRFYESGDTTQSVIDLDALAPLEDALDDVASAIMAASDPRNIVAVAGRNAQAFEYNRAPDKDLGDLLANLADVSDAPDVNAAAEAALDAYEPAIVSSYVNGGTVRDATGLSIYFPNGSLDRAYLSAGWSDDVLWDDMLSAANSR